MIETIHPEQLDCGEGPMWDSDARRLYWTNAVGQAIYSYDRSAEADPMHRIISPKATP